MRLSTMSADAKSTFDDLLRTFSWLNSDTGSVKEACVSRPTGRIYWSVDGEAADEELPEDRARAYGMLGAAFGLGFIVGPGLAGAFAHISYTAPIWAAAAVTLYTVGTIKELPGIRTYVSVDGGPNCGKSVWMV